MLNTTQSGTTVTGTEVVAEVRKFLGDQYVYGATGPNTFDCSGLTQYVYKQLGISIPRTSEEQFTAGVPVSAADAQPGDLVFFGGSGPGYRYDGTPSSPGHVGIYIGNGQMINAPTQGEPVDVKSIVGNVGFRRILGVTAGTGGSTGTTAASGGSGSSSSSSSLFAVPDTIITAFTSIDSAFADFYKAMELFFKPSTWVRVGSGIFGLTFVLFGIFFLLREAHE